MSSVDRRDFVKGALIGGFAAATVPVSATTIQTSTEGLEAGEVAIPVGQDKLPAYRARPLAGRDWPLVIVIQEIFGVHEHIRDVCRRFAKLGAYAIAPELFFRQGNPGAVADMQTLMRDIVARVPDAQVMSDLDTTLAWSQGEGATGKAGITGFCWGGRVTWLYSSHSDAIAAGVAWYGRLVGQSSELQPVHPVVPLVLVRAPTVALLPVPMRLRLLATVKPAKSITAPLAIVTAPVPKALVVMVEPLSTLLAPALSVPPLTVVPPV